MFRKFNCFIVLICFLFLMACSSESQDSDVSIKSQVTETPKVKKSNLILEADADKLKELGINEVFVTGKVRPNGLINWLYTIEEYEKMIGEIYKDKEIKPNLKDILSPEVKMHVKKTLNSEISSLDQQMVDIKWENNPWLEADDEMLKDWFFEYMKNCRKLYEVSPVFNITETEEGKKIIDDCYNEAYPKLLLDTGLETNKEQILSEDVLKRCSEFLLKTNESIRNKFYGRGE